MLSNKKVNAIGTEFFIRGRKLNISLFFTTESYFAGPENIRLNSTNYFIMKIRKKQELQQIEFNHFSDINFKYYESLQKIYYKNIFFLFCSFWNIIKTNHNN